MARRGSASGRGPTTGLKGHIRGAKCQNGVIGIFVTDVEGGEGADEVKVGAVRIVVGDLLLHRVLNIGVVGEVVADGRILMEIHAAGPGQGVVRCHTTSSKV